MCFSGRCSGLKTSECGVQQGWAFGPGRVCKSKRSVPITPQFLLLLVICRLSWFFGWHGHGIFLGWSSEWILEPSINLRLNFVGLTAILPCCCRQWHAQLSPRRRCCRIFSQEVGTCFSFLTDCSPDQGPLKPRLFLHWGNVSLHYSHRIAPLVHCAAR